MDGEEDDEDDRGSRGRPEEEEPRGITRRKKRRRRRSQRRRARIGGLRLENQGFQRFQILLLLPLLSPSLMGEDEGRSARGVERRGRGGGSRFECRSSSSSSFPSPRTSILRSPSPPSRRAGREGREKNEGGGGGGRMSRRRPSTLKPRARILPSSPSRREKRDEGRGGGRRI